MPTNYIKDLADKYNIPIAKLETAWDRAKESVSKKDYKTDESYYAVVTTVFKNIINKDFNLNEGNKMKSFKEFINEAVINEAKSANIYINVAIETLEKVIDGQTYATASDVNLSRDYIKKLKSYDTSEYADTLGYLLNREFDKLTSSELKDYKTIIKTFDSFKKTLDKISKLR